MKYCNMPPMMVAVARQALSMNRQVMVHMQAAQPSSGMQEGPGTLPQHLRVPLQAWREVHLQPHSNSQARGYQQQHKLGMCLMRPMQRSPTMQLSHPAAVSTRLQQGQTQATASCTAAASQTWLRAWACGRALKTGAPGSGLWTAHSKLLCQQQHLQLLPRPMLLRPLHAAAPGQMLVQMLMRTGVSLSGPAHTAPTVPSAPAAPARWPCCRMWCTCRRSWSSSACSWRWRSSSWHTPATGGCEGRQSSDQPSEELKPCLHL